MGGLARILTITEQFVFENRWVRFFNNKVLFPNGSEGNFVRWEWAGIVTGVQVVPVHEDGRIGMIKNFRYPADRSFWEFPGGGSPTGKDPCRTAQDELRQEGGVLVPSDNIQQIGGPYWAQPALIRNPITVFLAKVSDDMFVGQDTEATESIGSLQWFTRAEIEARTNDGTINSMVAIAVWKLVQRHLRTDS